MKKITITGILLIPFLLQGCSSYFGINQPIDWGNDVCPKPSANQIDSSGYLIIENGKTKRCQLRPYVSNMYCTGIVEDLNDGKDIICTNKQGKQIIFLFDSNDILESHG